MADKKNSTSVEINLLPGDDFEGRPGGKFLKWALTWGKRIVILTEAVVILAFLSRFWLDTIVADQAEQITQKKNVIVASANFEKIFRAAVERINKVGAIDNQVSLLSVLDKAKALVPSKVAVTQMTVSATDVSLSGQSDEQSLALLVSAFRSSPNFSDLTVEKISKTNPSVVVDFSMKAKYLK